VWCADRGAQIHVRVELRSFDRSRSAIDLEFVVRIGRACIA
jgi:hypothetical protein